MIGRIGYAYTMQMAIRSDLLSPRPMILNVPNGRAQIHIMIGSPPPPMADVDVEVEVGISTRYFESRAASRTQEPH